MYTEVLFHEKGVRFIAIGNNVDSADRSTSEFAPFINIMSEWYLRDCSRKQCAAYQARGRAGKPTTNHAIYGYRKDPEDKHHWLIDDEAAAVVQRIFRLSIEGYGPSQIAGILRDDKIERPSVYMGKRGQGTQRNSFDASRPYDWSSTSITHILAKPEYMGHTVNFRSYKESYKDKHAIKRPPEEWMIFLVWIKKMLLDKRCGARVSETYRPACGNYSYNGKTSGKVETPCVPALPNGFHSFK